MNTVPKNNLYSEHKYFISKNTFVLKENPDVAKMFINKIENNKYSGFHFLNYPLEYQINFIKKYNGGYYTKIELIKQMEISKEEKTKLLTELAEIELENK
jgi:hypothetical protein